MRNRKLSFSVKPVLLLSAATLLLVGTTVGSTRAALTYYSENYTAQVEMQSIGVTLTENGNAVSSRDYTQDSTWNTVQGTLLSNMLGENEKFTPGKAYTEAIGVTNSGDIDTFVRVTLTKSWQDENGKDTTLDPDLIELNLLTGDNGWVIAEDECTTERTVLYYTKALPAGEAAPALSDTLRIDESIAQDYDVITSENKDGVKTITYAYTYSGYAFTLEAEVDAVQTHNAKDAIKSAWGVDVAVSDDETTLSLQ